MNDETAPHPRWQHPSQQVSAEERVRLMRSAIRLQLLREWIDFWMWEDEMEDTR